MITERVASPQSIPIGFKLMISIHKDENETSVTMKFILLACLP